MVPLASAVGLADRCDQEFAAPRVPGTALDIIGLLPGLGGTVLEMRPACERCDSPLPYDADACICSFECTFCVACTTMMGGRCPNCGGELVARPRRGLARPRGEAGAEPAARS